MITAKNLLDYIFTHLHVLIFVLMLNNITLRSETLLFRSENLCISCLTCLADVLETCQASFDKGNLFYDLFSSLCCLISVPTSDSLDVAPVCEELKLETVRCISTLCRAASLDLLRQFYGPENLPLLGHAVTVLLGLARQESMRRLRAAAIHCLVVLTRADCKVTASLMGDIFAAFLPGMVSSLAVVITGDPKQGHLVTCSAVAAWWKIVVLVLGDANLDAAATATSSVVLSSTDARENLMVRRTNDWVESVAEKLKPLTEKVAKVSDDTNWMVRLAMVELAENLLLNCTKLVFLP